MFLFIGQCIIILPQFNNMKYNTFETNIIQMNKRFICDSRQWSVSYSSYNYDQTQNKKLHFNNYMLNLNIRPNIFYKS